MRKKQRTGIFITAIVLCVQFSGCEAMATLFHGPKPEKPPVTHTVTYDANGADGTAPAAQTVKTGTAIRLPSNGGLNWNGKERIFTGWSESSTGIGLIYVNRDSITVTGDMIFYAQWFDGLTQTCTIEFRPNGASGTAPSMPAVYGGMKITIPGQGTLVNGASTFAGWNTDINGGGDHYNTGSSYTVVGSTAALYAQWVPSASSYTAAFNPGGGSYVPGQTVISGFEATRPADPTRNGYTFDNWYSNAGLSTVYEFSAPVTRNITVYAKWNPVPPGSHTVTFNSNGGSGVPAQTVNSGGTAERPENPTRSGYTFDNWYGDSGLTSEYDFSAPVTGDITVYAKWNPVPPGSHTVTFHSNGGSGVPAQTVNSGGTAERPEDPTRSGYTFDNWYGDSGLTSEYDFSTPVTRNIILYAKWTANSYTIAYQDVDDMAFSGTHGSGYPTTHTYGTATALVSPTKTGYVFGGWFIDSTGTGTALSSLSATGYTANITLYAKWLVSSITSSSGISMAGIPGGTFTMGSPTGEPGRRNDETQHEVTLTQGFYMGKYPVTQGQWVAVMGASEDRTITTYGKGDNYPVYYVRWYDALVFCNKLSTMEGLTPAYRISGSTDPAVWGRVPTGSNTTWDAVTIDAGSDGYRLPTEAQWEYACRAGTTTAYNWGTDYIDESKANYRASTVDANNLTAGTNLGRTTEVGSYDPNDWGLYDMHGNVFEWCWDRYGPNYYASSPASDPSGLGSGSYRVLRGGSWWDDGQILRSAHRYGSINPGHWYNFNGFRLVRP